jgi:hypothetical protein
MSDELVTGKGGERRGHVVATLALVLGAAMTPTLGIDFAADSTSGAAIRTQFDTAFTAGVIDNDDGGPGSIVQTPGRSRELTEA